MKQSKIKSLVFMLLLLVAGLYVFPLRMMDTDLSKIPGDHGDARFINYILEHGHQFLTGQTNRYWDAPFMYPLKNVIAYSDNLLGTMPLYSLLRSSGYDRETSFQLWILILFALNFIACYYVLRKWTGDSIIAGTGAYIFAFSIFILGHTTNAQTFPRFIIPFVFYWAWLYLTERNIKHFLWVCLGVVFQMYCGVYLGFFLIYSILFMVIAYWFVYNDFSFFKQFKNLNLLRDHLLVLALAAVALTPVMLPYLEIHGQTGDRSFDEIKTSIPTIPSHFFTSKTSLTWQVLSDHLMKTNDKWYFHVLFPGAIPWLGILLGIFLVRSKKVSDVNRKMIRFSLIAFGLTFVFSLNVGGVTLYKFISEIPGFGSIRSVNRVMNTQIMFFVLVLVFALMEIKHHYPKYYRFFWYLPLLVIIDNLIIPEASVRFEKADSQLKVNNIKEHIQSQTTDQNIPVAYMTVDEKGMDFVTQLDVMLACQELSLKTVNGYSGWVPDTYKEYYEKGNENGLKVWLESKGSDVGKISKVYDIGERFVSIQKVTLKAANGKFVCNDHDKGFVLIANRDEAYSWETFMLVTFDDNAVALLSDQRKFVCAEIGKFQELAANRERRGGWETFKLKKLENGFIALQADNGKYVTLDPLTQQLFAWADTIGENEKFLIIEP